MLNQLKSLIISKLSQVGALLAPLKQIAGLPLGIAIGYLFKAEIKLLLDLLIGSLKLLIKLL